MKSFKYKYSASSSDIWGCGLGIGIGIGRRRILCTENNETADTDFYQVL